ncbi:tetratricopeptide repeat protein [Bradyrhizobium tropiciagri]|uniref:tetratricopeptide repeat protein n=1 Tax=Bradyrhizobium tropiciagri TaxID=312253 RepID=UPI001FCD49E6|nr:tetratricopeptide repeat protein [Bradyrhizobium tropiciagri]
MMLTGCASLSDLREQWSTSDLADAKEFDPAMRERISRALIDADEQNLRAALDQRPDNVNAAISLARALLARNSSDEALQVLNEVLLAAPGDLRALNAKGVVLDQQGRHEEAQVLYRQGLAIEPTNSMLRNNLKLSAALEGKTGSQNSNQELQTGDQYTLARSRSHSQQR